MARQAILPAVVATLLAFAPLSSFAQEAAAQGEAAAGRADRAHKAGAPMIRLDFGAGRTISVRCGETDIAACVDAITPLAEKLAATPPTGHHKERGQGRAHHKGEGKKGWKGEGHKPGKEKPDMPRHEKPAEPSEAEPLPVE